MTIPLRIAPAFDSYRPLRSLPEPDLIPTVRVEYCACGEYVRQLAGDTIPETVRRHNGSIAHRAWRYSPGVSGAGVENTEQVPDRAVAAP